MKITVKFFATLSNGRVSEDEFQIPDGADIDTLLKKFNLKREEVAIIFINGKHAEYSSAISDGDVIAFFPPIGGG